MKTNERNNNKVVTFGEVIMRLSPGENRKFRQSNQLDFFFGGTEMNVAASLCQFGLEVRHLSNVSNDAIGDAALAALRSYGIDTRGINKVDHPLGLYFLETGTAMRPGKIAYNRLNGAFANIAPESVDWEQAFEGAGYFHWTGISPGISEGAYLSLKQGLELARAKGITVTADPAYRSNLWNYGKDGKQVLKELVSLSTIFIGGVNEINEILNTDFANDRDGFIAASKELMAQCPHIEKVFDKVRTGMSATWQKIYGQAWTDGEYLRSEELEITAVTDRIGTGDAYAAGILYGLQLLNDQETLAFANAACALKHTILGDVNLVTVEEVMKVAHGDTGGRIIR